MGAERRIPGANRRDLRRSDRGRLEPNRTRIYPPIRGPLPSTTAPVVADAALDAERRSGWQRASPGAVLFFEFFYAGRWALLYNVANVVRRRA